MGLYGTETKLAPRHDWTKPGMSEETKRKIQNLTKAYPFAKRVAKFNDIRRNRQLGFFRAGIGFGGADFTEHSPNFRFTFRPGVAEEVVEKKMKALEKCGAEPWQVTPPLPNEDDVDAAFDKASTQETT